MIKGGEIKNPRLFCFFTKLFLIFALTNQVSLIINYGAISI